MSIAMNIFTVSIVLFLPQLVATDDPSTTAWHVLNSGLAEENPTKRAQAIAALGEIGARPDVVKLVEEALTDKDSSVRQIAAATLGDMKSRRSIPKLKELLEDPAPEVNFTAAKVLWEMGNHSGKGIFLEVLAGERSDSAGIIRGTLRSTKAKLQNPAALALIGAKEGAGFLFGPLGMGITLVEGLTKDSSATARALSAGFLGSDPKSVDALEAALNDKSWVVRAASAKALGNIGFRDSIPKLAPLMDDKNESVRYTAAATIVRLSGKKLRSKQSTG
jgi:HEAT repeat protein